MELLTYRYLGHSKSDLRVYRTAEEENGWRGRDCIARQRRRLVEAGVSEADVEVLEAEARERIEAAYARAAAAPAADRAAALGGVTA